MCAANAWEDTTMPRLPHLGRQVFQRILRVLMLVPRAVGYFRLCVRSRMALAAEHLFLQRQLALYQARNATWRRDLNATRLIMV
jgi:hypothetical protein